VASGHTHSRGAGKSASKVSKTIKRVIFGDKTHPVPWRPVNEEREKHEYRAQLQKKINERERLQKVR
jgi:hypothetical protein